MDCATVRSLMLEFVEGTLSPEVAAEVKAHIEGCPACMAELEKQSSRTRVLQSLGRVKAPDQWEEISATITRTGNSNWYWVKRYGIPAAIFGATAAIVAITLIYLLTR